MEESKSSSFPAAPPPYSSNVDEIVVKITPAILYHNLALRDIPTRITCPHCHFAVTTIVERNYSKWQHFTCLLMCICQLYCCSCFPYFVSSMDNVDHYCPVCNAYLADMVEIKNSSAVPLATEPTEPLANKEDENSSAEQEQLKIKSIGIPLGEHPVHIICPFCCSDIWTVIKYRYSTIQNLGCLLMFISCSWCCSALPYFITSLDVVEHSCPICKKILGYFD